MTRSFVFLRSAAFIAITLLSFLLLVSGSFAQSGYGNSGEPMQPVHYGMPFSYGSNHASTAAEGYLRGRAAVIDAIGSFEVNDAQAQILREHARSLDRENSLKQTEALHLQKKMWNDARIEGRNERLMRAAQGQQLLSERRATIYRAA